MTSFSCTTSPPHYVLFIPEQFSWKAHMHSLGRGWSDSVPEDDTVYNFLLFYQFSRWSRTRPPHSVLFIPEQFIGKAHTHLL